jgi:hypothetical protein
MTCSEAVKIYSGLPLNKQISFLAHFAFSLTIMGRETYDVESRDVVDGKKLRGINEIQHKAIGQMLHLIDNDPKRYSDSDLLEIIYSFGEDYNILPDVDYAATEGFKFS